MTRPSRRRAAPSGPLRVALQLGEKAVDHVLEHRLAPAGAAQVLGALLRRAARRGVGGGLPPLHTPSPPRALPSPLTSATGLWDTGQADAGRGARWCVCNTGREEPRVAACLAFPVRPSVTEPRLIMLGR